MEALLGQKVFLELFVRVEPKWSRRERGLDKLGY
jgi:GTP-binding protein Era